MKTTIILGGLLLSTVVFAQVGIGTVTPNAQLDIVSTDQVTPANTDGLLIPKIDEYPLTPPTALQDGMLVYATGLGTVAKGFYYWDDGTTSWVSFGGAASSDDDWYKEGTTTAPNAITDNIFTQGEVGIGTNTPNYGLDITESTHDRGINLTYLRSSPTADIAGIYAETNDANPGNTSRGFYNFVQGSDGNKEGIYNRIEPTGNGTHIGTRNQVSGDVSGAFIGVNNVMNSGSTSATQTGFRNQISASGVLHIGLDNSLINGIETYGVRNSFGASVSGIKYGISNSFLDSSPDAHYGLYNSFSGASNGNRNGSYTVMQGTGTGSQVGHRVDINMDNNIIGMGFASVISGATNATLYGSDMFITNTGTGTHYGTRNRLSGAGTGIHYGTYNQLSGTGNGVQFGTYQDITTNGVQDQFGTYNNLVNDSRGSRYGSYSNITGSDPGGPGTKAGSYNLINITGDSGDHYGVFNFLQGDGDGVQYGSFQSVGVSGANEQFGTHSTVVGSSAASQYGSYQNVSNSGTGASYGSYSLLDGTGGGIIYGSFHEITNSGIQDHYGTFNSLAGNSTGSRFGSYNLIGGSDTAGLGEKYGTYNAITISGNGTHFGTFNTLSGTGGGDKYGVLVNISPASPGVHYGVASSVGTANGYAGYFTGNLFMANGRADFTDASLDATPTTGSGILELGGNLRLDANEIITNTTTTLFLQHDNNGDLRVDNNTLMVDASANRVGIGTITPGYTLDVVGDINTSGNIRQTGGAYNFPDYVFESYYDSESSFKPNYKLKDLSEIEKFIKENKHLPGVQSREDVSENGWNISENVQTNLEKIEELFLYVIEIKKENELLKEKLKQLEAIHLKD